MVNFHPEIEDAQDDQLKKWVNETAPQFGVLASDELTRRELSNLNQSIQKNTKITKDFAKVTKEFNKETSSQTQKILILTFTLLFVGLAQLTVAVLSLGLNLVSAVGWALFAFGAVVYIIQDLRR